MKTYKSIGKIDSLSGAEDEITILEEVGNNDFIVDYKGVRCHALFNFYVNKYYVDDIYRRIEQ